MNSVPYEEGKNTMSAQPQSIEIYQPDGAVHELKLVRPPDVVIAEAKLAADELRKIIDGSQHKPQKYGDKEHLLHEHWETLGHFFGYCTKIESTKYVEFPNGEGGFTVGFEATALLINERTGAVVGRVDSMCLDEEEQWGEVNEYEWQDTFTASGQKVGRERVAVGKKSKALFMLRSQAQTRASSKAFRMKLAWVAVLAGYDPTPAAEITPNLARQQSARAPELPTEITRKTDIPPKQPQPAAAPNTNQPKRPVAATAPRTEPRINEGQARRFYALWHKGGKTRAMVIDYLLNTFGIDDDRKIPKARYAEACAWALQPWS